MKLKKALKNLEGKKFIDLQVRNSRKIIVYHGMHEGKDNTIIELPEKEKIVKTFFNHKYEYKPIHKPIFIDSLCEVMCIDSLATINGCYIVDDVVVIALDRLWIYLTIEKINT